MLQLSMLYLYAVCGIIFFNHFADVNTSYPGIFFYNYNIGCKVTASGGEVANLADAGISLSFAEGSVHSSEPRSLVVRPCFAGPFKLPDGYVSASPAYLIHIGERVTFKKDVILRIQHYASLQTEEDCDNMVFLSASSTPEYEAGFRPIYTFKEIKGAKGVFKVGDQVGEIALRHFCIVKIGDKRGRVDEELDDTQRKRHRGMVGRCLLQA